MDVCQGFLEEGFPHPSLHLSIWLRKLRREKQLLPRSSWAEPEENDGYHLRFSGSSSHPSFRLFSVLVEFAVHMCELSLEWPLFHLLCISPPWNEVAATGLSWSKIYFGGILLSESITINHETVYRVRSSFINSLAVVPGF